MHLRQESTLPTQRLIFFLTWVVSQVHPESEEAFQEFWLHSTTTTQKSMTSLTHCLSNIENNLIRSVSPHVHKSPPSHGRIQAKEIDGHSVYKPNGNFPPLN